MYKTIKYKNHEYMYIIHTEVYNYYKYVLDHLHAEYPKQLSWSVKP